MAQFIDRGNVPVAARVTGNRDLITSPSVLRWVAEGKVFQAGQGCESTAVDCGVNSATIDETLPTFSLQAPPVGVFVVPLELKIMMTDDGDTLSNWQICFTKAATLCATTMKISGTAMHHVSNLNATFNNGAASVALYTPTVSALTVADYISIGKGHSVVDGTTTGKPNLGDGASNVKTYCFLGKEGLPHIMANGSAMLVYLYTATAVSKWTTYIQWAELTANDLY